MKKQIFITSGIVIFLSALTACTRPPVLSPEERAFLVETRRATEEAKNEALQAAAEAKIANKAAETAAATVSSISEKTSRLYEGHQAK